MAVTLDDLPYVSLSARPYLQEAAKATAALLAALARHRAPAVGFVNEQKLERGGDRDGLVAVLRQWVEAGHVLGNHTYAHRDANAVSVEAFAQEIVKGEPVMLALMAGRGARKYFRHPMTHTGDTAEKKAAIERVLAERGYTVAPHTIENADYLFNAAYVRAGERGDAAMRARLRSEYVDHTLAATAFAEQKALEVFGRHDLPQTLLIHANALNADTLDTLLTGLAARGYTFVTLDAAMADPAYATADTLVSRHGPTWLFRWARSLGKPVSFAGDPEPPAWVTIAPGA